MLRMVLVAASTLFFTTSIFAGESDESLFVVHFTVGPNWDHEKSPAEQEYFADHSANLGKMRAAGTILFGARYEDFGMIIIRSSSIETGSRLLESDPGVASGLFTFTISPIYPFYEWKE